MPLSAPRLPYAPRPLRRPLSVAALPGLRDEPQEQRRPAARGPALGSAVRDLQDLGYLPVAEALHVPQHHRAHALAAQGGGLGVVLAAGRGGELEELVAGLVRLAAALLSQGVQAGIHGDLVQPGAKSAV